MNSNSRCVVVLSAVSLIHTARALHGESASSDFLEGPRDRAAQVVLGIRVPSGKTRASFLQDGRDGGPGQALSQQFLGDPFVGDAPIGLWEPLRNPQLVQ